LIPVRVGIFLVTFAIPGSFSLKDKRRVLRSILGKAKGSRRSFNISIAEVSHQNEHRFAGIAATIVSSDTQFLHSSFGRMEDFFSSFSEIEIRGIKTEIIPFNYDYEDMMEVKYGF
jgi:hypothetical protein